MSDEELIDALAKAIATSIFDGRLPSPANVVDYRTEAVAALAVIAQELDALRAENARLLADIADWKIEAVTFGADTVPALRAENARLREERDNALHRAAEYRDKCNSLSNENRALRAARAAMGECDV